MFYEIRGVKQLPGEPYRRWFQADEMDLTVWLAEATVVGFQLSYDRFHDEKSIVWQTDRGFSHLRIDDGEQESGHYKASPIVTGHLPLDFSRALHRLEEDNQGIDPSIVGFVLDKLREGHQPME